MPSTQLPKIGLYKGWSTGEKGWGDQVNENFCKLDALLAVAITGQVLEASLPATGNQGEQYYLTDTNQIATYQGSQWLKCPAPSGLYVLDKSTGLGLVSDGVSLVEPSFNIPTATQADVIAGTPLLYVTSDTVNPAIDSKVTTLNTSVAVAPVDPVGAPNSLDLPFACNSLTGEFFWWNQNGGGSWKKIHEVITPLVQTTAYDVAGAGAGSANQVVTTTAQGGIDSSFIDKSARFANSGAYETSIGGAANLVGGEYFYNTVTGVLEIYNQTTSSWSPVSASNIFTFDETVAVPIGVTYASPRVFGLISMNLSGVRINKKIIASVFFDMEYGTASNIGEFIDVPIANFPTIWNGATIGAAHAVGSGDTNWNSGFHATFQVYPSNALAISFFITGNYGVATGASARTHTGTFVSRLA